MTAGAVLDTMGAHELMCWQYLLTERASTTERAMKQASGDEPVELSVEDEIAAWRG